MKKLFCNHQWEILSEKMIESPAERFEILNDKNIAYLPWLFKSKYICILKCTKCGKLNKTIEDSP